MVETEAEKRKKKFEEKYPPIDIEKEEKRIQKAKAKYSMDAQKVNDNLTEYLDIKDPIVWKGKAIAWVKRPTMKQLKALIPKEMRTYVENPQDVPEKLNKKYEGHFYGKMADLIAIPKHTAKEWEEIGNPWFMRRFWEHIAQIAQLMEGNIESF